jgi:hypothetical protein
MVIPRLRTIAYLSFAVREQRSAASNAGANEITNEKICASGFVGTARLDAIGCGKPTTPAASAPV